MVPDLLPRPSVQAKRRIRVVGVARRIDQPAADREGSEPGAHGCLPKDFRPRGRPLRLPARLLGNAVQVRPAPAIPVHPAGAESNICDQS